MLVYGMHEIKELTRHLIASLHQITVWWYTLLTNFDQAALANEIQLV